MPSHTAGAPTGAFTAAGSAWSFAKDGVGVVDVGGGGVIHCLGGTVALMACIMVGPRQDQYVTPTGLLSRRKRNSVALQVRGAFLLWAGFIGLNAVTASQSIVTRTHYVAQVCPSIRAMMYGLLWYMLRLSLQCRVVTQCSNAAALIADAACRQP